MSQQPRLSSVFIVLSLSDKIKIEAGSDDLSKQSSENSSQQVLDLKKEFIKLSNLEIRAKLQEEHFEIQGHNITTKELAESLKNLWIGSEDAIEIDEDDRNSGSKENFIKSSHTTLMEWTKHQRLANHEKFHIFSRYIREGIWAKQLCYEYSVSITTIWKIIKDFNYKSICWNESEARTRRNLKASSKLTEIVSEFHERSNQPYLAKDVVKSISNIYGVKIPLHIIKCTMSKILNLSFKKGKSMPISVNLER